jgi:hypothetical protein
MKINFEKVTSAHLDNVFFGIGNKVPAATKQQILEAASRSNPRQAFIFRPKYIVKM